MPFNLAKWFIEGEVDWDYYQELLQSWGPALAGALFGAGACSVGSVVAGASTLQCRVWHASMRRNPTLCSEHCCLAAGIQVHGW